MTAPLTTPVAVHPEAPPISRLVQSGARCWACQRPFTEDEWTDRHGPTAEGPDHADYHAHCCPDCDESEVPS